jgi:hypothetical protein
MPGTASVLVVVVGVRSVPAPVVHVVDMVPVRHGHMTTAVTADMVVIDVFFVSCAGHRFSPPFRPNFDS